jgi:phage terminase small subunit
MKSTKINRVPPAPGHLEPPEKTLWRSIAKEFAIDDPGSISILSAGMDAHQRARRCRERIDAEGETITDRFEQTKVHPHLASERDARAAFLAAMRVLNLDVGGK